MTGSMAMAGQIIWLAEAARTCCPVVRDMTCWMVGPILIAYLVVEGAIPCSVPKVVMS